MPKSPLEVLVNVQLGGGAREEANGDTVPMDGVAGIFSTGVTIMGSQIFEFWA